MADKKTPGDPKKPLQEEDIIARLKSAAGGELAGLTSYTGLLGRSSREGYWLLYPSLDMSSSIEIQESDIVHSEPLSPEQSPFGGLGGTRLFVRKGAQVTTTRTISRTHQAGTGDEFDLDIRVGRPGHREKPTDWPTSPYWFCQIEAGGQTDTCGGNSCGAPCGKTETCDNSCNTCLHATCTCHTCPTCQTKCQQWTCYTKCTCLEATCTCDTYVANSCHKVCQ